MKRSSRILQAFVQKRTHGAGWRAISKWRYRTTSVGWGCFTTPSSGRQSLAVQTSSLKAEKDQYSFISWKSSLVSLVLLIYKGLCFFIIFCCHWIYQLADPVKNKSLLTPLVLSVWESLVCKLCKICTGSTPSPLVSPPAVLQHRNFFYLFGLSGLN